MNRFFSSEYFFSTGEKFKYWYVYLPFFGALVFLPFLVSFILKRKEDYKAKRSFERQFFWMYLFVGILGLASVFARAQNLPVFGNRFVTFAVLGFFGAANIWLVVYFLKVTKKQQVELSQKKRKEKWLKKK